MTTTMALAATSSVGPEMTSLDIMPATRMATKPAWKAGWVPSVTKVWIHETEWTGKCRWLVGFGTRFLPLTAVSQVAEWDSAVIVTFD